MTLVLKILWFFFYFDCLQIVLEHADLNATRSELDDFLDDSEYYVALLAELVNDFPGMSNKIYKIKCAAHTVQLIVRDAMKQSNAENIIKVCRMAVKFLRKSQIRHELRAAGIPCITPKYDCVTRWSSTYLMVRVLFYLYLISPHLLFCVFFTLYKLFVFLYIF